MDHVELGRRLRARRAALGRTVASISADAGLSVPYVANLENGRGNPTLSALDRLATALGTRLTLTLSSPDDGPGDGTGDGGGDGDGGPVPPPALLAFARTRHFRREAGDLAALLGEEQHAVQARLLGALAAVAHALHRQEMPERDWQRLLDALVLVLAHPAG
ncbi:helix-turn-helix domain-containing protein [Planobispora siamensis]|nr:helix-turn-helix transcriptional regulator [Planobispora siamensis]